MTGKTIDVDGRVVEVSNVDKVLFPDEGITKGDLIDYYRCIADIMLPHVQDRPLTLQRFPDGIDQEGFYQKEIPGYFPGWIERIAVHVEEEGSSQFQALCQDAATLVYLANQACITPHVWLSRADKLDHPDRLVFDLDPPGNEFETVRFAAHKLHDLLAEVELVPFVMTTGSRGLHVVTPLDRSADFDEVRAFVRELATVLAEREPDRLTTEPRKEARRGRLFLDYLRNSYAQNTAAPYAVRAKPGAPIATPLDWHELSNRDLHAQSYTMRNLFRRLGQKDDPWRDVMKHAGSLREARHRLNSLS